MRIKFFLAVLLSLLLTGCGYNQIQINDEQVTASWSEVLNQYKRRADLIPNLVQVVQGYAAHEKEVLTRVTEARANVAGIKVTPELVNDPDAMAKFQKAQGEFVGLRFMSILLLLNTCIEPIKIHGCKFLAWVLAVLLGLVPVDVG